MFIAGIVILGLAGLWLAFGVIASILMYSRGTYPLFREGLRLQSGRLDKPSDLDTFILVVVLGFSSFKDLAFVSKEEFEGELKSMRGEDE